MSSWDAAGFDRWLTTDPVNQPEPREEYVPPMDEPRESDIPTYEEDKTDFIIRLFESYGVELNDAQRNVIRRELLEVLQRIVEGLW